MNYLLDRLLWLLMAFMLCAWLTSCSHKMPAPDSPPIQSGEVSTSEVTRWKYLPDATATLEEANRVQLIEEKVNEIRSGQCLKDELLKEGLKLNETSDTPAEVYKKVTSTNVSAVISYYYQRFTSAVAYAENGTFYFNRRMIGAWDACDFVSTAMHETTHLSPLNYSHAYNYYEGRNNTVPYYMNQIAEKCCK